MIIYLAEYNEEELKELSNRSDSVYYNGSSAECALLSCGATIEMAKAVINGKIRNGFAIVRPPGHHAEAHSVRALLNYHRQWDFVSTIMSLLLQSTCNRK